jgi:hypothetical protein
MMKPVIVFFVMFFVVLFHPGTSVAAVVDSSSYGFTVRYEQTLPLTADTLFVIFHRDVDKWWDPDHTWSGNAANLSIEPFANGCFCEKLSNGGSVRHMNVIFSDPGKVLRMEGGLGPLQQFAVNGVMTLEIKPDSTQTRVSLTYSLGGYIPGGAAKFAPLVDQVLGVQFKRFVGFNVEK